MEQYFVLNPLAASGPWSYLGLETLAGNMGMSREAFGSCASELQAAGCIRVETEIRPDGKHGPAGSMRLSITPKGETRLANLMTPDVP